MQARAVPIIIFKLKMETKIEQRMRIEYIVVITDKERVYGQNTSVGGKIPLTRTSILPPTDSTICTIWSADSRSLCTSQCLLEPQTSTGSCTYPEGDKLGQWR